MSIFRDSDLDIAGLLLFPDSPWIDYVMRRMEKI